MPTAKPVTFNRDFCGAIHDDGFMKAIRRVFSRGEEVSKEGLHYTIDELTQALILADVGVRVADDLAESLNRLVDAGTIASMAQLQRVVADSIVKKVRIFESSLAFYPTPFILLAIGANGVGKTTTIAKIAHFVAQREQSVMLVAADTFRAAAQQQLAQWRERLGGEVVYFSGASADPSAVVFDAVSSAVAKDIDVVIIDTAGRLPNNSNLMNEMKKINRVIGKVVPGAPHERLLLLDSTTGRAVIDQVEQFSDAVGITGYVVTKLDTTAKPAR